LLDVAYVEPPRFFFKNAYPDKWGVRHGRWKLILEPRNGAAELYDLVRDPGETHNLSAGLPDEVMTYSQLIGQWYEQSNDRFVAQLTGYQYAGGRGLRAEEMNRPGPKIIAFGTQIPHGDRSQFRELSVVNPIENLVAWTKWVSYPTDKVIRFKWINPKRESHAYDFTIREDWSTTEMKYGGPFPMASGVWHLELWDGTTQLAKAQFRVDERVPAYQPRQRALRALKTVVGYYPDEREQKAAFTRTAMIAPEKRPVATTTWVTSETVKRVIYRWHDPSGKHEEWWFDVAQGWNETRVKYNGELPVKKGAWRVEVIDADNGTLLSQADFNVE
jgi:hypothetical protein